MTSRLNDNFVVDDDGELVTRSIKDKALHQDCADGTGVQVNATTGKLEIVEQGSSAANGVQRDEMSKYAQLIIKGNLADTRTGGGVFSVENTYGTTLIVQRVTLYVTTGSSGASTVDVGTAGGATTSADDLLDGVTLTAGGSAFVEDNIGSPGTDGYSSAIWSSGSFVTASEATGDVSGLVGTYEIRAVDMN